MADFKIFGRAVFDQYTKMAKDELYVVEGDSDEFVQAYLKAFPEGTDPIYRTHTEHDCSCCKQFIRNLGRVVSINDEKISTVWDVGTLPYPYDVVAKAMRDFVRSKAITGVFRTKERFYGKETTRELLPDAGQVRNWNHFHGQVANRHWSATPEAVAGPINGLVGVLRRGLEEITAAALKEVLDLIDAKQLYKGQEYKPTVVAFRDSHVRYHKLDAAQKVAFVWARAGEFWARTRNTAIGTLLVDLSEGKDIEDAVKAFEVMVAPTNYKRPTAVISASMVENALKTIRDLGLEPELNRRFANLNDISVNNVLWAAGAAKGLMRSPLEDALFKEAAKTKVVKEVTATDVSIEAFLMGIVPKAKSIEALIKHTHAGNFVSLTAPQTQSGANLFKWDNNFGWSYDGNLTDSIKERVKAAGGNVTTALLRISLAWNNYDDLDLAVTPPRGERVYFANKLGILDVDMNAGTHRSKTPVENASFKTVTDGVYAIEVHQFNKRGTDNVGFTLEIESGGVTHQLSHLAGLAQSEFRTISLRVEKGVVVEIKPGVGMTVGQLAFEKWGIKTENWAPVSTILTSPNHWDQQGVGHKHWFFMLDGCKNPEPARGIYNEFLRAELEPHRKVFEVLGNKTKCPVVDNQLSGIGFSETKPQTLTVRVNDGNSIRNYNVSF